MEYLVNSKIEKVSLGVRKGVNCDCSLYSDYIRKVLLAEILKLGTNRLSLNPDKQSIAFGITVVSECCDDFEQ